ncbi:hypothetical protein pb186bvf_002184 [Paramecium bursaria]
MNSDINLYIENRQDTLIFDQPHSKQAEIVIEYIGNELKHLYQTDLLSFRDQENQLYEIDQIIKFLRPHTFITIPHLNNILTPAQIFVRDTRNIYKIDSEQVIIERYKGKRKTETTTFQIQSLINMNSQYQQRVNELLGTEEITPKKVLEPESPKFGSRELKQAAGNDGVSQFSVIQKRKSIKVSDLKPITPQELAQHSSPQDAWIAINSKVYDVTYYLDKHPGGRDKLLQGVGQDGTPLFMHYHPWVNAHYLLEQFQVGFLVVKKQ